MRTDRGLGIARVVIGVHSLTMQDTCKGYPGMSLCECKGNPCMSLFECKDNPGIHGTKLIFGPIRSLVSDPGIMSWERTV